VVAVLVAVAAVVVLAVVLFWLAVAAALLVGLAALHLVYLPRLAGWVGVAPSQLALGLLPLVALGGWAAAGEAVGLLWGAAAWAALVAAPRLALARAGRRLGRWPAGWTVQVRSAAPRPRAPGEVIEAVACPRCGRFRIAGEPCPTCDAERPDRALPG
jgi:hypothetical protein